MISVLDKWSTRANAFWFAFGLFDLALGIAQHHLGHLVFGSLITALFGARLVYGVAKRRRPEEVAPDNDA